MFCMPSPHRSVRIVCLMVCVPFFFSTVQLVSANRLAKGSDITLTADQTNLAQGQCTTLHEHIPEGWSLVQPLGMMMQAEGYRGGASIQDSMEVCPTKTTTYSIWANYSDGTKQASVTITVSSLPFPSPTQPPAKPSPVPIQPPANSSTGAQAQISNEIYYAALRRTPGYSNKDNTVDLLANVPAGDIVQILGGPEQADGLTWWYVSWNGQTGWMADHTGSGKIIMIFLQSANSPIPTSVPPTLTPVPPTWTPIPPTWTIIPPTQEILPTAVIPPSTLPVQSQITGLHVVPIDQHWASEQGLSSGKIDNGKMDCGLASLSMALVYFKSQGILNSNDTTDFHSIIDNVRSQGKYADINKGVSNDGLAYWTAKLTNNKVEAQPQCVPPEQFSASIQQELDANRPVIGLIPGEVFGGLQTSFIPQWIAQKMASFVGAGHAWIITGLQDQELTFIDPDTGKRGTISVENYTKAFVWNDACKGHPSLGVIEFKLTSPQ